MPALRCAWQFAAAAGIVSRAGCPFQFDTATIKPLIQLVRSELAKL
jgi:hypothetical protein